MAKKETKTYWTQEDYLKERQKRVKGATAEYKPDKPISAQSFVGDYDTRRQNEADEIRQLSLDEYLRRNQSRASQSAQAITGADLSINRMRQPSLFRDYMAPLAERQKEQQKQTNPLSSSRTVKPKVQHMIGNVDINDRPIVELGNDKYATTETTFQERWKGDEENGHYNIGHFATITKDGRKMSDREMNEYIDKVMDSDDPFETDRKGLNLLYKIDDKLANGEYIRDDNLEQAFKEADDWDVEMHNLQDSMYKDKRPQKVSNAAMEAIRNYAGDNTALRQSSAEERAKNINNLNDTNSTQKLLNIAKRQLMPNYPNGLVRDLMNEYQKDTRYGGNPYEKESLQPTDNAGDRIAYSRASRQDPKNPLNMALQEAKKFTPGASIPESIRTYVSMSPLEKQRYHELYGEYGVERAEDFKRSLTDSLNYRMAKENYDNNNMLHNSLGRVAGSFVSGVKNFNEGIDNDLRWLNGSEQKRANTVNQYEQSIYRDRSANGVEDIAQDLAQTAGMMAPSALIGNMTGNTTIADALFGASIGGNAYQETINQGYSRDKAGIYATQQAIDEFATNELLNGVAGFGGGALQRMLGDTRIARAAHDGLMKLAHTPLQGTILNAGIKLFSDMGGEFTQEFLQNYTDKITRNLVLGEDNEITLTDPEAWYSAALGALNALVMNSSGAAVNKAITYDAQRRYSRDMDQYKQSLTPSVEGNTRDEVKDVVNQAVDNLMQDRSIDTSESTPEEAKKQTETLVNAIQEEDTPEIEFNSKKLDNNSIDNVSQETPYETEENKNTVSDIPEYNNSASEAQGQSETESKLQRIAEDRIEKSKPAAGFNIETELNKRSNDRFSDDEDARTIYKAYFEDFREAVGKDSPSETLIASYDDNMAKAYDTGLHGQSLATLSQDKDFSRFDRLFPGLTDTMWQMGVRRNIENIKGFRATYKAVFGTQGQSAFDSMVRSDSNFSDDANAFTRIYNAGRYGKDIKMAGDLSRFGEKRSTEIFNAGSQDKEAEYDALSKYAAGFLKNPKKARKGVFINTSERTSEGTRTAVKSFTDKTGISVVLIDSRDKASLDSALEQLDKHGLVGEKATVESVFRTKSTGASDVSRGFIVVDINTENLLNTLGHEITHIAKVYDPEGYKAYAQAVLRKLSETDGYNLEGKIAYIQEQYKKQFGQELSRDLAEEEIVSEAADFLNDEEVVKEIISKNKSFAEKFRDWLKAAADMIKGIMDTVTSREEARALRKDYNAYKNAAELWTRMLDNVAENMASSEEMETLIRNQLDLSEGMGSKVKVPGNPMSVEDIFSLDDELMDKSDKYDEATKNAWKNIIEAPDFVSLGFPKDDWYYTLTPSARKEWDYQLTHFDKNGAIGDSRYKTDNMDRLYDELVVNTPGEGVDVTVVKTEDMMGSLPEQTKFQMDKPIEKTKDLIAVHNLSTDNLLKSLQMGGFPSPSIAIIKDSMFHDKYGDCSVYFYRDTIDPKVNRKNKAYGGDAWTPTYPPVQYKISEKKLNELKKIVDALPAELRSSGLGGTSLDVDNATDLINRFKGDAVKAYKDKTQLKYAFITANDGLGMRVLELPKQPGGNEGIDRKIIEAVARTIPDEAFDKGYHNVDRKYIGPVRDAANAANYEIYQEKLKDYEGKSKERRLEESKHRFEMYVGEFDKFMRIVWKYKQNNNQLPMVLDENATKEWINEQLEGHEEEYHDWLRKKFDGIIEKEGIRNEKDVFTRSGNRRSWETLHDEVTLDNLVKAMNLEDAKGGTMLGTNIMALATKDFKSVDEIHAAEYQLQQMSDEEYKKLKDEYFNRYSEITSEIRPKHSTSMYVDITGIIADALRSKKTVKGIDAELRKYLNIQDDTAQRLVDLMKDLAEMPYGYFEAKPQRAVYNNEIAGVLIPDTAKQDLIDALNSRNIRSIQYKANDGADRKAEQDALLEGQPEIRFQIDTSGRKLSEDQADFFADSKVRDESGHLMVMYHGTPNGSFNVFRNGLNYFTAHKEYATAYMQKDTSGQQPRIYEVYLNMSHPFDIRNAKDRKLFIDDYVKGGWALGIDPYVPYKDTTNSGLPSWEEADNIYDWMEENDLLDKYDGIVLDEANGVDGLNISYVTFNPNQIKNIDNENPTDSDDIRYQLDIPTDMFYNEDSGDMRTEQANAYLTNMLQASKDLTPSESDIKKVVNEITETYHSKMKKSELTRQLRDLYTYMRTNEHVDGAQVSETINAIARQVIREATFTDSQQQDIWDRFRKEMRNTSIYVNPEFVRDIDPDGMASLRKHYFGRVNLTSNPEMSGNDGIRTYIQLQQQFPDIYTTNVDDITSDADAIREILYGFEKARPRETSVFGDASTEDEASTDLAQRIMDAYFEVGNQSVKTQYQKTYKQLREEMKEDIIREYNDSLRAKQIDDAQALSNLNRSRKAGEISEDTYIVRKSALEDYKKQQNEAAHDLFMKKRDKYVDRIQRNKYKDDIIKTSKQLAKMILSPTDKQHIPTEMVEPISKVLQFIDFSSNRVHPDGTPTKRTVESDEFHKSITSILGVLNKIDNNKSVYENNGETSYLVIDPDLMQNLRELSEAFANNEEVKDNIDNLSTQNLRTVQQTLRALNQMVNNANRFISMERAGTVSELSKQSISDFDNSILNRGKIRQKVDEARKMPVVKVFDDLLTSGMLDAYTYFYGLGNTGMALYEDVRAGLDRKIRNTRTAVQYMEDSMERNNVSVKDRNKWENDLIEVELRAVPIGGRTATKMKVKLSAAQIMSLYLLNKRGQARMHLYADSATNNVQNGGFIIEPSGRNKLKMDDKHVFKVTEAEADALIAKLTPQQKAVADDIGRFLTEVTSKWGNEVTQKLYGYNKFEAKNYFPIKVDNSTIATTSSTLENAMFLLKNMGQTKSVQQRAYNPITLQNIFDVYCTQADDMGSYNAFVTSTADLQMWINYKGEEGNVKRALANAYGKKATDYFTNLLKDINMPRENGSKWDKAFGNLVGLQRGGAIWGNFRVAIQQPFAYVRAAATMDPKYLLQGLTLAPGKKASEEWELAKKYAPIAQWKDYGFFDIGVGPSMKRVIMGNDTIKDKVSEAGMMPASLGDTIAWVRLWYASQAQVKAEHPDLKPESEEFYQEAGKVFGHVVDTTQVVDSVLHRSDVMKDKSTTVKNATAFLSEPTKTFNMMFRAMNDFVTAKGKERAQKGKILASTTMVWAISQVVNSAVASLISAFRNHDKDKDLWEKYISKVIPDFIDSMMIWNSIPMVKQWLKALNDEDQDNSDSYELLTLIPTMRDEFIKTLNGKSKKGWWGLLYQASQLTTFWGGNNMQNPLRDIEGVIDNLLIRDNMKAYYPYLKSKYNMYATQESSSGSVSYPNLKRFITVAMKAYANGDKELGDKIVDDLIKRIPEEKVDEAMIGMRPDAGESLLDQSLDAYMRSRFSKFNKLYREEEKTDESRELKRELLNELIDFKMGDVPEDRRRVYDLVEESGNKNYLPSVLDGKFSNKGEEVQLTSSEYQKYQDAYEKYYYKFMGDTIDMNESEEKHAFAQDKAKSAARALAEDMILSDRGVKDRDTSKIKNYIDTNGDFDAMVDALYEIKNLPKDSQAKKGDIVRNAVSSDSARRALWSIANSNFSEKSYTENVLKQKYQKK